MEEFRNESLPAKLRAVLAEILVSDKAVDEVKLALILLKL